MLNSTKYFVCSIYISFKKVTKVTTKQITISYFDIVHFKHILNIIINIILLIRYIIRKKTQQIWHKQHRIYNLLFCYCNFCYQSITSPISIALLPPYLLLTQFKLRAVALRFQSERVFNGYAADTMYVGCKPY